MSLIYASRKGSKLLFMGMNHAKRVARAADRRDQTAVLREIGPGYPRQRQHHQQLVLQRHAYYKDLYDDTVVPRAFARGALTDAADAGDADRAVPEPSAGAAGQ